MAGRDCVRECVVCLHRQGGRNPGLGLARRVLRREAWRTGGLCRGHRSRQEFHRQFDLPLLRIPNGPNHHRWGGHPRHSSGCVAQPHWRGAARRVFVQRIVARKCEVARSRHHRRPDLGSHPCGWSRTFCGALARRVGPRRPGTGSDAQCGAAPIDCLCEGLFEQPAHPHPR